MDGNPNTKKIEDITKVFGEFETFMASHISSSKVVKRKSIAGERTSERYTLLTKRFGSYDVWMSSTSRTAVKMRIRFSDPALLLRNSDRLSPRWKGSLNIMNGKGELVMEYEEQLGTAHVDLYYFHADLSRA